MLNRTSKIKRFFLIPVMTALTVCTAADDIVWHDIAEPEFNVQGFAWFQQEGLFRRLPVKIDPPVCETVAELANDTAGGQIRFQSDTEKVLLQVDLGTLTPMEHMTQRGTSGFDLYAGIPFHERFVTSGGPRGASQFVCELYPWSEGKEAPRKMRSFIINFPLYNPVKAIRIGLNRDAKLLPPPEYPDARPILVYGTSITQGCSASRPGNAITNILSRRLNRPVYNFGFSGSGVGEVPLMTHLAKIQNPALLIFDCEANAQGSTAKNVSACIREYRKSHPDVPILWVSGAPYSFDTLDTRREDAGELRNTHWSGVVADQKKAAEELQNAGDSHLYFLEGAKAWKRSDSDEMTIDGCHFTDHGFYLAADLWETAIREILSKEQTAKECRSLKPER